MMKMLLCAVDNFSSTPQRGESAAAVVDAQRFPFKRASRRGLCRRMVKKAAVKVIILAIPASMPASGAVGICLFIRNSGQDSKDDANAQVNSDWPSMSSVDILNHH